VKVAGLIAAAGRSERMGRTKALLPLGGETFVSHLARVLRRAHVAPIVVTLPEDESAGLVRAATAALDVSALANERPDDGLIGSIVTALHAAPDADALVLCPVDMPFVTPALIGKLVGALGDSPSCLAALPSFGAPGADRRTGHPVVFAHALFAELLEQGLEGGARAVLERHSDDVAHVPWGDERVLANINTPADFERWMTRP